MVHVHDWLRLAWLVAALGACSGKTEHGGAIGAMGDPGPAQKPAAGPSTAEPAPAMPDKHLLMVVELSPASHVARTLTSRAVDLPLPRRRGPVEGATWRVDVLAQDGTVLFSAPLADAGTVRGEFRDDRTGELRGVTTQKAVTAVTLRLPWLDHAKDVRVVSVGVNGDTELGRVAYPEVKP